MGGDPMDRKEGLIGHHVGGAVAALAVLALAASAHAEVPSDVDVSPTTVAAAPAQVAPAVAIAGTTVGYYEMCSEAGVAAQVPPIETAGLNAQIVNDPSTDLDGIDILFADNCSNGSYATEYLSALAAVDGFVYDGGVLVLHDRWVSGAAGILPGGSEIGFVRDTESNDSDIDIQNDSTLVTNGPGGVLDNSSLDGGNSSSHGYATNLPGSADLILSRPTAAQAVTFSYPYGAGWVVYSTIPLDYYLAGNGEVPAFASIYSPNVLAYAANLRRPRVSTTLTAQAIRPQGRQVYFAANLYADQTPVAFTPDQPPGQPLPHRWIRFYAANGTYLCEAMTGPDYSVPDRAETKRRPRRPAVDPSLATCSIPSTALRSAELSRSLFREGYRAVFEGDANYAPSESELTIR